MEIITSTKNEKIKNISALLRSKKERDEQGVFVIEGIRIFRDTLKSSGNSISSVFVSESFIRENSIDEDLDFFVVKDSVFDSISGTVTPQGILCVVKKVNCSIDDIIRDAGKILVLENIQDPGNLGTMVRTAEAAGISGIVMNRGCADIYNPKVIRSTMGSVFRVPFIYCDDFCETVRVLKKNGISVYAAYLHGGEPYNDVRFDANAAIMIGNEGNGLTDEAVSLADKCIYIPMAGQIESLNAAIAAAILMFHR